VPTFKESGYDGFDGVTWYGIVGPANMPEPITRKLSEEINKILATQELRDTFRCAGTHRDADDAVAIRQVHRRRGRALDGRCARRAGSSPTEGESLTLPEISVSEQLVAAFGGMPSTLPAPVVAMVDSLLMDVAGLCVAARNADYVRYALHATGESGACTLIGHASGVDLTTAALCNGIAAHGEDFDDTFEGGPVHAGAVIVPAVLATANSTRSAATTSRVRSPSAAK
jgi:hypothetical protein